MYNYYTSLWLNKSKCKPLGGARTCIFFVLLFHHIQWVVNNRHFANHYTEVRTLNISSQVLRRFLILKILFT